MPRTPDSHAGPLYEEAIIWEEQSSDPSDNLRLQYVQDKGLLIHEDGIVHGVGEGRDNVWQPPVEDRDVNTPPGSPVTGYRVVVGSSPTGDFVGHAGEIAQWDSTSWVFSIPKQGTIVYVLDESTSYQQVNPSSPWSWSKSADPTAVGDEPVGFPNRTDSVISFVDGTRTFTISPAVSSFDFYTQSGAKWTKTSGQSVVITDTEGLHYVYFDTSGVIQSTTSWTNDIILKYAFVSAIYWDATNNEAVYIGDERHGITMDGQTHLHWHNTFGTSYYSGLALNSLLTDENGSLDTHAQLGTDSGVIADEDIVFSIAAKTAPAQITVLYRDGASGNWRKDTATNFPVKTYSGGSSRLAWNEWTGSVWQQTEVSNNGYVLCHLFAVNDTDKGWIAVQGQSEYANIASAQEGASSELVNLVLNGLPVAEFSGVATVIFQTSNSYSNTPKARTRTTEDGSDWIDWRRSSVSPVSAPVDALTSDTHKALRQLIHFISEGPAEGFVSGAYREQLPSADPFPTSIIWWESSSKLKKIVERTITWTGVNPTTDEWKMYDVDGTTNLVTVSDAISYSGVFETTRTRTITVS